jgi:hypothetical protein
MRGLNTLVIVMSLLLVAGFSLLIYGIVSKYKAHTNETAAYQQPPAVSQTPTMKDFEGSKTITLPQQAVLLGVSSYENGAILHVNQMGTEYLYFVNMSKGTVDATLKIERSMGPSAEERQKQADWAQEQFKKMQDQQRAYLQNLKPGSPEAQQMQRQMQNMLPPGVNLPGQPPRMPQQQPAQQQQQAPRR